MSDFRERLVTAVEKLGGDPQIARDASDKQFQQVIHDSISFIAGIDFIAAIDSPLITPQYVDVLSIWVASGAVEGAGSVLKVLKAHGKLDLPTAEQVLAVGVPPEYLKGCYQAGISNPETISEGWKSSIPLDYLAAL